MISFLQMKSSYSSSLQMLLDIIFPSHFSISSAIQFRYCRAQRKGETHFYQNRHWRSVFPAPPRLVSSYTLCPETHFYSHHQWKRHSFFRGGMLRDTSSLYLYWEKRLFVFSYSMCLIPLLRYPSPDQGSIFPT